MENKKQFCLYLNPDYVLGIQDCGIENLSSYVNEFLLQTILLEKPDYTPSKQAKIIAARVRKERVEQKRLIEETRSFEEQARELMEVRTKVFNEKAGAYFKHIETWFNKLPENDHYGDFDTVWVEAIDKLSVKCAYPITIEDCQKFVRTRVIS